MTDISTTIWQHVAAGYNGLWVCTREPARVQESLVASTERAKGKNKPGLFLWECVGEKLLSLTTDEAIPADGPAEAIQMAATHLPQNCAVLLPNFHRLLDNALVIQAVHNAQADLAMKAVTLVVLAPETARPPVEAEPMFKTVRFALPRQDELKASFTAVAKTPDLKEEYTPEMLDSLAEAALGLTLREAENAAALSVTLYRKLQREFIAEQKAETIRATATLEVGHFAEAMDDLHGMDTMKQFASACIHSGMYRGILVLGPAGTGKSHFAKALGNAGGLPTVIADVNRIMAAGQALVGQAEAKAQQTVDVIDVQNRCVVMFDEIEKGLSGAYGGYQGDGGAKSGVGSVLLRWMSDRPEGKAYVIGTCNDISLLPPEWLRAERWDAIFFVDLPDEKTRAAILSLYADKYGVDAATIEVSEMEDWTGAEIKSLARISKMLGNVPLNEAAQYVVPVSKTAKEKIDGLREWAKGRAVPANPRQGSQAGTGLAGSARAIRFWNNQAA
jgi:hypothetical protein